VQLRSTLGGLRKTAKDRLSQAVGGSGNDGKWAPKAQPLQSPQHTKESRELSLELANKWESWETNSHHSKMIPWQWRKWPLLPLQCMMDHKCAPMAIGIETKLGTTCPAAHNIVAPSSSLNALWASIMSKNPHSSEAWWTSQACFMMRWTAPSIPAGKQAQSWSAPHASVAAGPATWRMHLASTRNEMSPMPMAGPNSQIFVKQSQETASRYINGTRYPKNDFM